MDTIQLYNDIKARTNGEIYMGVVGPVRSGKSTFIKRFMDVLVLPHIEDENDKKRSRDELPQSASGKTIMTTEPKFVPKEAAKIRFADDLEVKLRLIDCVGYMVEGATGHIENGVERMVKTPWFEQEIPFSKAADIGTKKVIHDHSTVGVIVTTDGSIGELERERYKAPEGETIREMQKLGKPFIVLVNSKKPYAEEAKDVVKEIEDTYHAKALAVNCEQLKEDDIFHILKELLYAFPISEIQFFVPKWTELLDDDHEISKDMVTHVRKVMGEMNEIRDAAKGIEITDSPYIDSMKVEKIEMDKGCVVVSIQIGEAYYYETLSEMTGMQIEDQYELISAMKNLSKMKEEYESVKDAFASVKMKGYGMVCPTKEEITLDEPQIIRQGNKYGVKIHSQAPSIHLIRANVETEIAPIVGNEQQAKDLIDFLKKMSDTEEGIWGTNIFGKSVENLVMEGIQNKMRQITDESQEKLQNTMQKIVNDMNGGMVCIII